MESREYMFENKSSSAEKIIKKSKYWDKVWYQKTYLFNNNIDPIEHFLKFGWKRGYSPSKNFDLKGYLSFYQDVKDSGINPLLHFEKYGKQEGRFTCNFEENTIKNSKYFDASWYAETYHVEEPIKHYLSDGWKQGYNPSTEFSTLSYLAFNYDVRKSNMNPLLHFERFGKYEKKMRLFKESIEPGLTEEKLKAYKKLQDERLPQQYDYKTENLIIFLVPERDDVCGGLMSIASLARVSRKLLSIRHWDVLMATCPSKNTFCNYSKFEAGFDIFRFSQIRHYFTNLKNVIIHIPENFVGDFVIKIPVKDILFLQKIKNLQINIMNQNMLLMLRPNDIDSLLRKICPNLTMTVAHRQYCTKQLRTSYNMPIHLFSASNLTKYEFTKYQSKENILAYSPDYNPYKNAILHKIEKEIPSLKLVEIKNMSYEQYKKIISKAKWMITFGEGLDGYFAESIRSGAIPFAAYNNTFFNQKYIGLPNIYSSFSDMLEHIVSDMKNLDNINSYSSLNKILFRIDSKEYDDNRYILNVRDFYEKKYTYPIDNIKKERDRLLKKCPLISIVMATYNGDRFIFKQLFSLMKLTYSNYEIIISDDGSTDKTLEIIKYFQQFMPIKLICNRGAHGLNENFTNAIKYASGEFIALCDQDDVWFHNKLEKLLERIDDFDIVFGNVTVIDENDSLHPASIMHDVYESDKTKFYHFTDYIGENLMLGCTSLIRREFIIKCFPIPSGVLYHDWWFVLKAIKDGKGICYIDTPVIKYRQHKKNTAKTTFDDPTWYSKKAFFDIVLLNEFKSSLTEQERYAIEADRCWNIMKDLFRYRCTNYLEEFFAFNKMSFDPQLVESLYLKVSERSK